MVIDTRDWKLSAKELDSEKVQALLTKLKKQDEQMKTMMLCHEHGIMKVDLSDFKSQVSFIPSHKFKEFAKFLPEIVYQWAELLNRELKDHLLKLQRECTTTQDFVEFLT